MQSTLLAFVGFVLVLAKMVLVFTVHAMNGVVFFTLFVGNFLLENFCWKRGREERSREGEGRGRVSGEGREKWGGRGIEKEGVEGMGRE